jgi:hypothetical protein
MALLLWSIALPYGYGSISLKKQNITKMSADSTDILGGDEAYPKIKLSKVHSYYCFGYADFFHHFRLPI